MQCTLYTQPHFTKLVKLLIITTLSIQYCLNVVSLSHSFMGHIVFYTEKYLLNKKIKTWFVSYFQFCPEMKTNYTVSTQESRFSREKPREIPGGGEHVVNVFARGLRPSARIVFPGFS